MARVARRRPARRLIIILMLVALVALLVGLFYFATPADKIPSWLPGRGRHLHRPPRPARHRRDRRSGVCALAAWVVARRPRSTRR